VTEGWVELIAVTGPPEREVWTTVWFGPEEGLPGAVIVRPGLLLEKRFELRLQPYRKPIEPPPPPPT
jgi:hypothetical protein